MLEQGLALCRASDNRIWLPIVAGLGYAYALQGRLAEGHALLKEAITTNRTGGLQGMPPGSHGSARFVDWRGAVRRPSSMRARRSPWPASRRRAATRHRVIPAWYGPCPRQPS